jgi:hypothetical protein
MWRTHAPTVNKWHKKKEKNKNTKGDTPHVDTWRDVSVWVYFFGHK